MQENVCVAREYITDATLLFLSDSDVLQSIKIMHEYIFSAGSIDVAYRNLLRDAKKAANSIHTLYLSNPYQDALQLCAAVELLYNSAVYLANATSEIDWTVNGASS